MSATALTKFLRGNSSVLDVLRQVWFHRGVNVDIVAKQNSRISSALDGTVIFSEWTMETGYVIMIQHDQNIVTCYKHNAELLKKQGDKVKAGEVIAIMGNTGKETTGPHLHFELWVNGNPINPEDYISF